MPKRLCTCTVIAYHNRIRTNLMTVSNLETKPFKVLDGTVPPLLTEVHKFATSWVHLVQDNMLLQQALKTLEEDRQSCFTIFNLDFLWGNIMDFYFSLVSSDVPAQEPILASTQLPAEGELMPSREA